MRVVFAVPGDIAARTGGTIYDRSLMAALASAGHEVRHLPLPAAFPWPSPDDMAATARALGSIPDESIVIVDGLALGAVAPNVLDGLDAALVALVHHPLARETGLSEDQAAAFFASERETLAHAAHVLVPSPHTARVLISEYCVPEPKITVAPPGVRRPAAPPALAAPPHIVSVGLLSPRKGHDVLLHALSQITDLPWQAVIAGRAHEAAYAQKIEGMVADLGLAARVSLLGEVSEATLDDLYARATVFALASRYEGYGMVFSEALAAGLPIVACRAGAVPETVPAEAGLLVDPDDPAAFAGALRTLLSDPEARAVRAAAAARFGAKLPSWTDTARIVAENLAHLAPHRGPRSHL